MEYPFKDLLPREEVTARQGYYRDWTHIDANTFHQISELAKFIREKGHGADTREAIAQALERVYHDATKSDNANMEVSMARKNFKNLASRLDASDGKLSSATARLAQVEQQKISHGEVTVSDIDKNKGKLDQTFMTEEFLQQMAGDTPINAVPADDSITTPKIVKKAVTVDKTDFAKKTVTSDNLFNPDGITEGKFISGNVSTSDLPGYFISEKIGYDIPTTLTIRNIRSYRFYDEAGVAYGVVDTKSNTAVTTLTIPTGHTLEFSGSLSNLGTTQVNIGETLLPYDEYTEFVVIENLYISTDSENGNEEKSEKFKVVKNGNSIDVISKSGTDELIIKLNLSTRDNKLFNFLSTTLNGKVIHGTSDSITPIRVPYAIGANHGYPTGSTQIYPAVKNIDLRVEGVGDYNGTYTPDKLKIVESYDILDWNSVTEWETQNPSKPYADNLSQIDSVARLSTSYEFSYFGRCYISTSVYFYKSTEIGNLGFLQAEGLYGSNGDYSGVTRYAPDVNPVSGYDFQNGFSLNGLIDNLKIAQSDLKDSSFPIVRYADYTSDYGFTMGYFFDKGDTNPANRLAVADYYWDFRNTKKSYPIAYDATHTVSAGEYINIYGYRNYYLKDDDLTIYTEVEDGEAIYIYIDTNKPLDLKTKRTLADVGSKIEVLRNTGLTLISDYVTSDGIIFKTDEYCTAVLKINK